MCSLLILKTVTGNRNKGTVKWPKPAHAFGIGELRDLRGRYGIENDSLLFTGVAISCTIWKELDLFVKNSF